MNDIELIGEIVKRAEEHQKQRERDFAISELVKIKEVLKKAKKRDGLDYKDIAILLQAEEECDLNEIYSFRSP